MGFISQFAGSKAERAFPNQEDGARLWREAFGTTKEDDKPNRKPVRGDGGSWTRGIVSSDASFKRLLIAMRSMAPGGWSDDRWGQTNHFYGIAYVAIHRLATQWQQAEFQVFIKDPNHQDGKRPVSEDDPPQNGRFCKPYDLVTLLEKPNRQDSFGKLAYRWCQQKFLTGMALTWMVPNELGVPMELYSIPTAIAIPQPAINPDYPDGYYRIQPVYPYGPFSSYPTPNSAVGAPIPAQWMMRMLFPHPFLRYDGWSPMTALRLHLDAIEMMERSRHSSMRRGINPSAVLNLDDIEGMNGQGLSDDEIDRIHAEWENNFQGPDNAGRLIVGTPGGKIEQFGQRPVDMDYQAGWDQEASFLFGGFGITKPAAGIVEDSSYSTLYATLRQLNMLTLDPDMSDTGSTITRTIAPFFGDNLIVEMRCRPIDDHEITFTKVDKIAQLKGLPESVIRYLLKMMDLEIDDEMVKELAAAGEEQGGMPGMMPPGAESGWTPELPPEQGGEEEAVAETEAERPRPGKLSEGSLGPRMKSLSIYDRVMKSLVNGNGHH